MGNVCGGGLQPEGNTAWIPTTISGAGLVILFGSDSLELNHHHEGLGQPAP